MRRHNLSWAKAARIGMDDFCAIVGPNPVIFNCRSEVQSNKFKGNIVCKPIIRLFWANAPPLHGCWLKLSAAAQTPMLSPFLCAGCIVTG